MPVFAISPSPRHSLISGFPRNLLLAVCHCCLGDLCSLCLSLVHRFQLSWRSERQAGQEEEQEGREWRIGRAAEKEGVRESQGVGRRGDEPDAGRSSGLSSHWRAVLDHPDRGAGMSLELGTITPL